MGYGIDIWDYEHQEARNPPVIADCFDYDKSQNKSKSDYEREREKKLIPDLKKVAKKLGHTPSIKEFDDSFVINTLFRPYDYIKKFGTWGKALEAAKLKPRTDKDEMLSNLQRLTDELGHFPTEEQCNWCEYTPCYRTYLRKFGPWDEIKKMIKT